MVPVGVSSDEIVAHLPTPSIMFVWYLRRRQTVAQQEAEEAKAQTGAGESKDDVMPATKQFAGFLSHYKHECGTEARLVHNELKELLPDHHNALFLDSDDLNDLRLLLQAVKDTEVLVLLQSKGVLTVGRFQTYTTEHPDINTDLRTRSVRVHLPTQPTQPYQCTYETARATSHARTHTPIHHTHAAALGHPRALHRHHKQCTGGCPQRQQRVCLRLR